MKKLLISTLAYGPEYAGLFCGPYLTALLDPSISGNRAIYPNADDRARLYTISAGTPEQIRERTRLWTAIKTGR